MNESPCSSACISTHTSPDTNISPTNNPIESSQNKSRTVVNSRLRIPSGDTTRLKFPLNKEYTHGMRISVESLDDAFVHLNRICQIEGFRIKKNRAIAYDVMYLACECSGAPNHRLGQTKKNTNLKRLFSAF